MSLIILIMTNGGVKKSMHLKLSNVWIGYFCLLKIFHTICMATCIPYLTIK